jgi:hypothetical protein
MRKYTLLIILLVIITFAWAPWLTTSFVNSRLNPTCYKITNIKWAPFGRKITISGCTFPPSSEYRNVNVWGRISEIEYTSTKPSNPLNTD